MYRIAPEDRDLPSFWTLRTDRCAVAEVRHAPAAVTRRRVRPCSMRSRKRRRDPAQCVGRQCLLLRERREQRRPEAVARRRCRRACTARQAPRPAGARSGRRAFAAADDDDQRDAGGSRTRRCRPSRHRAAARPESSSLIFTVGALDHQSSTSFARTGRARRSGARSDRRQSDCAALASISARHRVRTRARRGRRGGNHAQRELGAHQRAAFAKLDCGQRRSGLSHRTVAASRPRANRYPS